MACDYLGSSRDSRSTGATRQIADLHSLLHKSSYGKFAVEARRVETTIFDWESSALFNTSTPLDAREECTTAAAHSALRDVMRARLEYHQLDLSRYDAILYYIPEALALTNRSACDLNGFTTAFPPVIVPNTHAPNDEADHFVVDRSGEAFLNGVVIRKPSGDSFLAHELGRYLGLGNAAGSAYAPVDDDATWSSSRAATGDTSAVMGTNALLEKNSFTAAVKWRLGWLPASAVLTGSALQTPFILGALSRDPHDSIADGLAAVLPCPSCQTRLRAPSGERLANWTGGQLWITCACAASPPLCRNAQRNQRAARSM